ncbi:zinc finger RNA-binding protein-like [Forsythia ovata]|uniref:Zinc finger RNA-binding protein-like n=1 Tax=Forsythia ovata TaxID=205694 RepID=A0ABD1UDX7_9LAMI
MQHPPPLNPNPNSDPYFSHAYTGYSTTPNPNSDPLKPPVYTGVDTNSTLVQPYPPGVDPPYVPTTVTPTVTYTQQARSFDPQQSLVAVDTAVSYYQDPNAAAVQNWVAAIWQLGTNLGAVGVTVPSSDIQNSVPANTSSAFWTNPAVQSQRNDYWKRAPKKTKVVQSAWCEVCKIECNSKDVLDQHKLGKKHKKNMEKLNGLTSTVVAASAPLIGPQEKQDKDKATGGQKTQKRAAQRTEDLETKRRKVLEGGAAADAVRACVFCNVVCNSETVFNHHLAGQKHAAMVKKHAVAGAM